MDALLAELVRNLPQGGGHDGLAAAAAFDKDRRFGPAAPDGTRRQRYERALRLSAGGPFAATAASDPSVQVLLQCPALFDMPCGVFPRRPPERKRAGEGEEADDGDGDGGQKAARQQSRQIRKPSRPPAKKATATASSSSRQTTLTRGHVHA